MNSILKVDCGRPECSEDLLHYGSSEMVAKATLIYGDMSDGGKRILKNRYGPTGMVSAEKFETILNEHI